MKKILLLNFFCLFSVYTFSQTEDVEKLHQNAKTFMRHGDYANASLILTSELALAPNYI